MRNADISLVFRICFYHWCLLWADWNLMYESAMWWFADAKWTVFNLSRISVEWIIIDNTWNATIDTAATLSNLTLVWILSFLYYSFTNTQHTHIHSISPSNISLQTTADLLFSFSSPFIRSLLKTVKYFQWVLLACNGDNDAAIAATDYALSTVTKINICTINA